MIKLIFKILVIAALCYAAFWLAEHPGNVELEWLGYKIQTLASVLVFVLFGFLFLFAAIISILKNIFGWRGNLSKNAIIKRQEKGLNALTLSFSALAVSDVKAAREHVRKAEKFLDGAAATKLVRAQIAKAEKNFDKAQICFEQMKEIPETKAVALRGLAELAMRNKNLDSAIEYAVQGRAHNPKDKWYHRALIDMYCRNGDWSNANNSTIQAKKRNAISANSAKRYRALIEFERAKKLIADGHDLQAVDRLKSVIKAAEKFAPAYIELAKIYSQRGEFKQLNNIALKAWKFAPDAQIADMLLEAYKSEPASKLSKRFRKLAAKNLNHLESSIALAKVAIHLRQWDIARNNLKSALTIQESPRIYEMLAVLEIEEMGDDAASAAWLKRGVSAGGDACYVCENCAHHSLTWSINCPECSALDVLELKAPSSPAGADVVIGGEMPVAINS